MSLLYKALEQALESGELIGIYDDEDEGDKFLVGRVLKIGPHWILLKEIGIDGQFRRFSLIKLRNIFKVTLGGIYIDALKKEIQTSSPADPDFAECTLVATLEWLRDGQHPCTITDTNDTETKGFIKEVDTSCFVIEGYLSSFSHDGFDALLLESVKEVEFGTKRLDVLQRAVKVPGY